MKRFVFIAFAAFFCLSALVSCAGRQGGGQAEKIADREGTVRIVSLAPSVTHTIAQLGKDALVVGRTSYCPAPLQGTDSKIIGNVLEVNIEEILLLQPDIVFCMAFTKEETIRKLASLGVKVKTFDTPGSFDEICAQTLEIGELAGVKTLAEAWVKEERAKVEEISRKALAAAVRREANVETPSDAATQVAPRKAFFQIGDNPVFPVIEHTYMNEYLTFLGLDNVVKDYRGGGLGRETVLALQPEIMFISRMSGEGERVLEEWKKYPSVPAVAEGRLLLVDDTKACCPTPLFFRETLQTLAGYLDSLR